MRILWIGKVPIFPHWLIMGRSRAWPDLRSPIYKSWTDKLWMVLASSSSESLKTSGSELRLWYELKPFWRLGHVTRTGDVTWCYPDKKKTQKIKLIWKTIFNLLWLLLFVFELSSNNQGAKLPPPPNRAKVEKHHRMVVKRCKAMKFDDPSSTNVQHTDNLQGTDSPTIPHNPGQG